MTKRTNEFAIYNRTWMKVIDNKCVQLCEQETVCVLSRAEGYAMVRKKDALPFVVNEKELRVIDNGN